MTSSRDPIPEGTPGIEVWAVTNDGHVIRTMAYKMEDVHPELRPQDKWDFAGFDDQINPIYDRDKPVYIVPGHYTTRREFLYDSAATAALVALGRWEREQERQEARLASVEAALESERVA